MNIFERKLREKRALEDLHYLLNDILNKALIGKDRIKGVPDSNKIAEFINKYIEENK